MQLSNQADTLIWKWNNTGKYTADPCYKATFQGSTRCNTWHFTWKTWAPQSVKFFH